MRVEEIIIADSSPLIALARIGQLPVLRGLAKRVVVPGAVWAEVAGNRVAPGAGGEAEAIVPVRARKGGASPTG